MVGPAAKREAVAHLQAEPGLSERRACSIAGADRTMVRYRSCRPPDTELRARLRELANKRRRFGYRGCSSCCEGRVSGQASIVSTGFIAKKGLPCASSGLAARAMGVRALILVEAKPNARWSLDFVYGRFANGRPRPQHRRRRHQGVRNPRHKTTRTLRIHVDERPRSEAPRYWLDKQDVPAGNSGNRARRGL
jgi:hypothetical protein